MTILLWFAGIATFALGLMHNFVFGPLRNHPTMGEGLWYYAGGLALCYAGMIDTLLAKSQPTRIDLWVVALVGNLALLTFVWLFAKGFGDEMRPQKIALFVLTISAIIGVVGRWPFGTTV